MNLIVLILFLTKLASADAETYCAALKPMRQSMQHCWQNSYFEAAAAECVEKFMRDVDFEKAKLAEQLQRNQSESHAAQDGKLKNNAQNLTQTESALGILISKGGRAMTELESYQNGMLLPGNPGESFLAASGLRAHLREFSCFREPFQAVGRKIQELAQKLRDLKAADAKAGQLNTQTATNKANLENRGMAPLPGVRLRPGEEAKGKEGNSSSISGELAPK